MNSVEPLIAHPRVLVVDDELGPRESLRMLLKPVYQIQTADNGSAALQLLSRFRPDVVIMDIKMPEIDGLELLRQVKRVDSSIEVIMITAYASLETVKLALTHGAFEYLIKPFSRQDMEDVVRRAILRRQADLGTRSQVHTLVEEMRRLSAKTRELEEAARREAVEESLRVTQLSILREISRTIVGQLDVLALTTAVTEQLRAALGYDRVEITPEAAVVTTDSVIACPIRDAQGLLGYLVVDQRSAGRPIDPRERELLEMLAEYLAIALRNARLYGEIADTKRSLEQLIASAGDAIISLTAENRVDGWNPAAERIFGISKANALGRPITELLPEGEYATAKRRLAEGLALYQFETSHGAAHSSKALALAVTLSALRGRDGNLDGLIAIVRDITAQREFEDQLRQSEKLTALGQLAGGIAHDFNNLLQAILGYAQLMKQNPDPAFLDSSLRIVESAALDGSETVRRIQQFARLRPEEQFVSVDVNQIVQDAVAITRPRWDEKIAHDNHPIELRLDLGTVVPINGRAAALTELMTNLILNALDAMPNGGMLVIATGHEPGRNVTVTVRDSGIGMTESVRQRVFEPFFSTKGEGGSGLGLAMAYSIARRHGGDIRVDSEIGRGTTFTLTFPLPRDPSEAQAPARRPTKHRTARLLLVDDEPKVLATLTDLLRSVGHAVTASPSGASALDGYAPGRFDIIMVDLGMAGMNGWEFVERLRAADASVPVLLITGWGLRDDDQARLARLGIRRCLFKPVQPQDLDAAIQETLA